jgi:hypothetical protein
MIHGPFSFWISKLAYFIYICCKYDKLSKGVSI